MVAFFEGGLGYKEAMVMPLPELMVLADQASDIAERRKKESEK